MSDEKKPNGHDDNVASFPDRKERKEILKQKQSAQKQKPASEPILNIPPYTKWLCVLLIAIHVLLYKILPYQYLAMGYEYLAFVPQFFTQPFDHLIVIFTSPLTHALMHGGWLHLLVNLGMLCVFGAGVERVLGARGFIALFSLSVICGALFHLVFFWGSTSPLVGASGGISGLFGVLIRIMQDRGNIAPGWRGLMPLCAAWVAISFIFAAFGPSMEENTEIAWTAHTGGFIAGLLAYPLVLRWLNKSGA